MAFVFQVKLVPSSNNKYTVEEKQEKTEFSVSNNNTQTIPDHSIITSDSSAIYDKK